MGTGGEIRHFRLTRNHRRSRLAGTRLTGYTFWAAKIRPKFIDRQIVLHKILDETAEPESKGIISFCSPGKILKNCGEKVWHPIETPTLGLRTAA
jgi:hypothetical protein